VLGTLRADGFAVASPDWALRVANAERSELSALTEQWDDMPVDPYLRDGGHYRRRLHGSFVVADGACELMPHRMHFQPLDYNALHGGMERWFQPLRPAFSQGRPLHGLLTGLGALFSELVGPARWYVEAHQFRIDTSEGIGRPTPEGAHRDGVDFVALFLIARQQLRGGESRVFDADGPRGRRFTLSDPWSALLLDDARVIHESTPIQPLRVDAGDAPYGFRDTLVLTYRRGGFQEK
jgi:hypothetical protein